MVGIVACQAVEHVLRRYPGDALVCAQRDNGAIPDVIATPYYQCWLNDAYTAVEGLRKLAAQD